MDLENQLITWANTQRQIDAVIRIGSRAQVNSRADQWSDSDYQVICTSIKPYLTYNWSQVFTKKCWCINTCITPRNVSKISLIFPEGEEIELVLLTSWQIKLLYFFMKYPGCYTKLPFAIRQGMYHLNSFVKPGYVILKGGQSWQNRLEALKNLVPATEPNDFRHRITQFWTDATWIYKQIRRGNLHTAQRLFHLGLREQTYALLEMEAKNSNQKTDIQARYIHQWISPERLSQINTTTSTETATLTKALMTEMIHFDQLANDISKEYHLAKPNCDEIKNWLLSNCHEIIGK